MIMALKLSKADAKAVDAAMADTQRGAGAGFREFIEHWAGRDPTAAVKNLRPRHPDLTDRELEWNARFGWLSDWPNGWYLRGVARRLATGNLDEFGLFLQMHVRQAVLNHSADDDEFTSVWPLLVALAIDDKAAVEEFIRVGTFPLKSGHPDTVRIFNGVHALLRSGTAKSKRTPKAEGQEKKPAWIDGIVACLEGIAARDPAKVAAGLEQHLEGFRKGGRINPFEKIISHTAHGLYRLAAGIDPDLVAAFDPRRGLPWDAEFHDWLSGPRRALSASDFGNCPTPLAAAFVTLKRPKWVR
jgi:hypothetical protein